MQFNVSRIYKIIPRGGWVRFNEDGEANGISRYRPKNLQGWERVRNDGKYLGYVNHVCTIDEIPDCARG